MRITPCLSLTLLSISLIACGGNGSGSTERADSGAPSIGNESRPTAVAGPSQTVQENDLIMLSGQATPGTGQSIRRVLWQQLASDSTKATLPSDNGQKNIQFQAPQVESDTVLTFIFLVEDNLGQTTEDKTTVLVRNVLPNRLPIAHAGQDQTVAHGTSDVTLNGCESIDPDGEITHYRWVLATSPAAVVGTDCQITTALSNTTSTEEVYVYELSVTDNEGAEARAQTRVTKRASTNNSAPIIERTQATPTPARPNEQVALLVSAKDMDNDGLRYTWTQTEGEAVYIANSESATASFTAPSKADTLVFAVAVSDGSVSVNDTVSVSVAPQEQYAQPTIAECLAAPTQPSCFSALKQLLTNNPIASAAGLSGSQDSAGTCNPAGQTNWPHFTGVLHDHTAYSDGYQLTKPADVFASAKDKGWSFAFTTDHSDNLGLPIPLVLAKNPEFCATNPLGCLLSDPDNIASNFTKWDATHTQALQASTPNFTAMRGFEWTSDRFGHANVLMSQHFINPKLGPGYLLTMEGFWAWFVMPTSLGGGSDGLMIFNHPGREDAIHGPLSDLKKALSPLGLGKLAEESPLPSNRLQDLLSSPGDPAYTFNDLKYVPAADYRVVGLEVFGKGDEYDSDGKKQSWLGYALDKGWYLAPIGSEDHHDSRWGDGNLPKTVIIARTQSQSDLREALLARRVYAVAQNYNHLQLSFTVTESPQGKAYPMGSRLAAPTDQLKFQVSVADRLGKKTPLLAHNTIIEVISSLADNSVSYSPLISHNAATTTFTLSNSAKQNWAFVRVRDKATGAPVAVSAPIWFKQGGTALPTCNNGR